MRVLLIEDDPMIGRSLVQALERQGMSVDWVRTGRDGHEALAAGGHSIVLLDLCLPGTPGLTILEATRRAGNRVPVLVITARDGLDDRIAGLDLGADDYLVFGRETAGLPRALLEENRERWLRIPMFNPEARSLNLSNCVATVLFEALRQQGFPGEI